MAMARYEEIDNQDFQSWNAERRIGAKQAQPKAKVLKRVTPI
jgi:hypothetical protein